MYLRNFIKSIFVFVFIIFSFSSVYAQSDLLSVGMKAYTDGRFSLAQEALEIANKKAPDDFRVSYWLAATYKAQKNYKGAKKYYLKTIALFPGFPSSIYSDLAEASLNLGHYDQALNYINTARSRGLNSPYLKQMEGVALLNLKEHDKALAAFQEVAKENSELTKEAVLYTGFTLKAMQNLEAAERSFQSALDIGRDDDLSVLARSQLSGQKSFSDKDYKAFSFRAGLSFQRDSNPTVKPNDDTLVALANIQGEKDYAKALTMDLGWRPKQTGPWGFSGNYNLYMNAYEDFGSQDVSSHNFVAAPFYQFKKMSISLPVSFNYTEVDHHSYLRQYSFNPVLSIPKGDQYLWQLSASGEIQDYATRPSTPEEGRDNKGYGVGGGFYWFFNTQDAYLNLRADAKRTNADGQNWDRDTYRLSGFITYPIWEKVSGSVLLSYTAKDFDNVHSTAFVKRDDDSYSGTAALKYQIVEGLDATLSHTRQRNKSNVILYDYDRNITNFSLQKSWRF